MSGKWAFSFSRGTSARIGAGARTGAGARMGARARTRTGEGARTGARAGTEAQASRIVLKILCKSSSEYLRTLVAAEVLAIGGFVPKDPAS